VLSVKNLRVFYMVVNVKNANMPRKLHRKINKTYKFTPKYNRESYIQYSKSVTVLKVIDVHIQNYITEMYEVFENLMSLSEVEINECLDVPKKLRK
jgi:hypothetical protein